jgi:hypothetical protein
LGLGAGADLACGARAVLKIISIIGWEKFQHYKDRDPPWVKLYRDLLTTESWVLGTDPSRLLQVASILLAARYENAIPLRWDLIKKVAHLDMSESQFNAAVNHLVESKFLLIQEVTSETKPVEQSASTVLATCTSEAEQRQSREKTEADKNHVPLERDVGPVERVFEHWRSEYGHQRSTLDPKRRRVIQAALKLHDEATLRQSISGYRNSPHHMGENERRTVYDDIELFLRDAAHIENGLRFARGPPAPALSAVAQARQKLRESVNGHGRVVSEQSGSSDSSMGQTVGLLR